MTTATELLTTICEKYIIYLLEEHDKEKSILRKIRDDGPWENEEEHRWVSSKLVEYLMHGSMYNYEMTINDWILYEMTPELSQLLQELEKEQYREEMKHIRKRLIIGNANINTLILNFYNTILMNKSFKKELVDYLNMLCPEFCPK
jgi:hypothetical protein